MQTAGVNVCHIVKTARSVVRRTSFSQSNLRTNARIWSRAINALSLSAPLSISPKPQSKWSTNANTRSRTWIVQWNEVWLTKKRPSTHWPNIRRNNCPSKSQTVSRPSKRHNHSLLATKFLFVIKMATQTETSFKVRYINPIFLNNFNQSFLCIFLLQ